MKNKLYEWINRLELQRIEYIIGQLCLFAAGVTLGIIIVESYLSNWPMVGLMVVLGLWNLFQYRNIMKRVK
jgi:hypothetical protein